MTVLQRHHSASSGQSVCFIVASNNEAVLRGSLLSSPDIAAGVEVAVQRGAVSAAQAYNRGIDATRADILVFVHQDVFLPEGWLRCFRAALASLESIDPGWGVLGAWGVTKDAIGRGWTYSTGLGRVLGGPFPEPRLVRTLDELLLVLRRRSGLRFDEHLEGFHLYGTDICLQAERLGLRNYVVPCFALHNSNGIKSLPLAFWQAYLFLRKKWYDRLPVQTPCTRLERFPARTVRQIMVGFVTGVLRHRTVGTRVADPGVLFRDLLAARCLSTPTTDPDVVGTASGGPLG